MLERYRYEADKPPDDYAIDQESFEVYVPDSYDGSEPYGLFVWINAGPHGGPREDYLPVLDQHKLIWIGANNSGNDRSFWHRAGLALDGRHNMMRKYRIDPMRVYVSGVSGGGRSASRVGPTYAELFAGAFPIIGVDYFTRLPHPDTRTNYLAFWGAAFNPPLPHILKRAKRDGRYVLLTGESDGNRLQTLTTFKYGYERAKFEHVTYLEVPGMGHELPPPDWFAKGIEAMDAPLDEVRDRREAEAAKAYDEALYRLQKSPRHGVKALENLLNDYNDTTYAPLAEAALRDAPDIKTESGDDVMKDAKQSAEQPAPGDRAREDLALAKNYITADRKDLARELLNGIVEYYPDSEEANQAQSLLADIN